MARRFAWIAASLLLLLVAQSVYSQSQYYEAQRLYADLADNRQPPPDTEFRIARVKFTSNAPGRPPGYDHRLPGWAHDYPDAEEHILQIASETTVINLSRDSYVIVNLDSDDLYKYPFAYFSEVGEMTMNESEVEHLREFFDRGGFAIADDLDEGSFQWFAKEMRRVFPNRSFLELDIGHTIFHSYYDMPTLDVTPPYEQTGPTRFMGYFDERGRLIMLVHANNDLGDYWEWIDQPQYPLPPSTEALRFGINYLVYSLTH